MCPILRIPRFDDWHLHLRDGAALPEYVWASAQRCRRALVMPNLAPPVTTTAAALAYRARILAALAAAAARRGLAAPPPFTPLMTLYLTEATTAEEIALAARSGAVVAAKLYPAGATTNAAQGVRDIARLDPVLRAMARAGLVLCVHGETTDPATDVFDREAQFIATVLVPLLARHPRLHVVMEHVTSAAAVALVDADTVPANTQTPTQTHAAGASSAGANAASSCSSVPIAGRVAATITPQHMLFSRNALFLGGKLRPHAYCLPVYKTERDRWAVAGAAAGTGVRHPERFFAGTDSAPHAIDAKCKKKHTTSSFKLLYSQYPCYIPQKNGFAYL